ncbi:hypothetical protein HLV35_07505 [Eggerthellaceae bacterium zg-997]|nr:hypothetical protein [Eggerthellaceae bacterium zg-997]
MLKVYRHRGLVFQFEESQAPQGAEEVAEAPQAAEEPQAPQAAEAPKPSRARRASTK